MAPFAMRSRRSHHGDDDSYDSGYTRVITCDAESDGNITGGRIRFDVQSSDDYSISDTNGSNNSCASINTRDLHGAHHRTGEKNWVWSFGNWQAVK